MNYFAHETVAERYARSRPYFQPQVIERVRAFLQLEAPVLVAIDVACGTGHSSRALAEIAESVIATDISPSMLARAEPHPRIQYVHAPAETLPIADGAADLLTVCLAFHWLDRARFLAEARRVLRPGAPMVIYSNGFYGRMRENSAFEDWARDGYYKRYPTPPRNNQPFTNEDALASGFVFEKRENYTNDIVCTPEELADYLLTQSNVITFVEHGNESLASVRDWLVRGMKPFFQSPRGTFILGGEIWYLRRQVVSDAGRNL